MTVISPPSYLQFGAHSAASDRLTIASLLQPGATPMVTRGGVRPSGDGATLKVTAQATPTNSVQIAAGTVFIPESDNQGVYIVHNDAPVTRTINNASTTQNRRDLVVVQVYDQEVSGTQNTADIVVIPGTSVSGTATAPAVPANAYALAEINVPAGSTTNIAASAITDRRATAVSAGGVLPVLSTALPANPYQGMTVYCSDDDTMRVWSGSTWRVQSVYPLPGITTIYPVASTQAITATAPWGTLPTRQFVDYTAAKPMIVMLHLAAWVNSVGSDMRGTLALTNATTGPGPGGAIVSNTSINWGDALYGTVGQHDQHSIAVPYQLNAGTTRIEAVAYRSTTAGVPSYDYVTMRIVPIRYV